MATDRVPCEGILSPQAYRDIENFCTEHPGVENLGILSAFLEKEFSVRIERDGDVISGYVNDQSNLPGHAAALARPAGERECAVVLCACSASGIPVTISAGRTNLTGSATPEGGIVLSLAGMHTPQIEVDSALKTVVAPVGMVFEDMRKSVIEQTRGRLFFPVDPTSRCDALVGGTLSCNASGFTPGESGAMRPWVRGLRLVTTGGHLVRAVRGQYVSRGGMFLFEQGPEELQVPVPRYPRPEVKNASGPYSSPDGSVDLVDLMVGSEGIFALITGCTLALQDVPAGYLDLFVSLPGETDALRLLSYLRDDLPECFSRLTACEYFGPNCRRFMDHEHRLFRADHAVGIYLQVALENETLDEAAGKWLGILQGAPCTVAGDAVMAFVSERDRQTFFEARHSLPANSLEVARRRGTQTIMTDTVVPAGRFADFLGYTHDLIRSMGLEYLAFGHLGDCHLHFMIMPEQAQVDRALSAYDRIIEKSSGSGGVYSGEHGTGKRKRSDFLKCHGKQAAEQVLTAKRALDPRLILNPGNVVAFP